MTVVQCPGCNSKFRIDLKALQKKTVKMRCSVCSHVFSYDPATGPVIEQDFDSVIGTHDGQLEESFSQPSLEELAGEITESTEPSEPGTEESHEASIEVEPESVIREIDSILGTGSEVAEGDADVSKKPSRDGSTLKMIISVVLIILVFLGISLWIMKDASFPCSSRMPGSRAGRFSKRGRSSPYRKRPSPTNCSPTTAKGRSWWSKASSESSHPSRSNRC